MSEEEIIKKTTTSEKSETTTEKSSESKTGESPQTGGGSGSGSQPDGRSNTPSQNQADEDEQQKAEPTQEEPAEQEEPADQNDDQEEPTDEDEPKEDSEDDEKEKDKDEDNKEKDKDKDDKDKEKDKDDKDKEDPDKAKEPGEEPKKEGEPKSESDQPAGPKGPDVGEGAADAGKAAGETAIEGAEAGAEVGAEAATAGAELGVEAAAEAGTAGTATPIIVAYEVGKRVLGNKYVRKIIEIIAWIALLVVAIVVIIIILMILGIFLWFAGPGPSGSSNKQPSPIAEQTRAIETPTGYPAGIELPSTGPNDTSIDYSNLSTYELIAQAPSESLSDEFKNWAEELAALDREFVGFFTDEIKKADTCEETLPLLEKNANILAKIKEYQDRLNPDNEEGKYYNKLKNFYRQQDGRLIRMADFNEIFEYLLIQTGQGGEIKGNMVDDNSLRQSRKQYLGPLMNYLTQRKIDKLTEYSGDNDHTNDQIKELEEHRDLVLAGIDTETESRDEKYPPALEFVDEKEFDILLPQTKSDFEQYGAKNIVVDTRVYYLLNYIYHVQEMTGPDFEIYKNSQFIQEPSSPTDILSMCTENLENDPSYCGNNTFCGAGQRLYAQKWLTDNVKNIGVPYQDRSHLKIWLGLNASFYADEIPTSYTEADKLIQVFNTHKDFKAIDISEIGLYNERIDCAACQGLSACTGTCLDNPFPCCPVELDGAADQYLGVPVVWQHNQKIDNIIETASSNILHPASGTNYGLPSQIGNVAQYPLSDLFGINFYPGTFNYQQFTNGNTLNLFTQIGIRVLSQILAQIGLSPNIAHNTNFANPNSESLMTNLGINYINHVFNLPNDYHTPISATLLPAGSDQTAVDLINYTPNLHLSPALHVGQINSIKNQNRQQANLYSLANAGIQEINSQITNWPAETIDPSLLSGNGIKGLANRLGELSLSEILGLPTNYLFDQNNPKNTYLSKSASLLSAATTNQNISYYINNNILSNSTSNFRNALQNLNTNNITQLFGTDQNTSDQIQNYLNDPSSFSGGHSSFVNDISGSINYDRIAEAHQNLTRYSLQTTIEQGTSENLGDELALTSISAQAILEKIGTNISDSDAAKIPYLLEYIAIENNYSNQPGFNLGTRPPELTALEIKFSQQTGGSESITAFRLRLIELINNSEQHEKISNSLLYLTKPIKVKFNQSGDLTRFSQDYIQNNQDTTYTFTDTTYIPDYVQNPGQISRQSIDSVLSTIGIDINSLTFIPESQFENNQIVNNAQILANQVYYAYPEIDLAEIIFPGIRAGSTYQNNVGQFKTLESLTNIIQHSSNQPITITIYQENNRPVSGFAGISDPVKIAMNNKYVLSYSPLAGAIENTDFLAHLGGTNYIFDTLNSIGSDNNTTLSNLANIGSISLAYRYNGIDPTNFTSIDINQSQVADIINTAGIINGYQEADTNFGMENMINFVRNQKVMGNITNTHSNIDLDDIFSQFSQGIYFNNLADISQIKQNFNSYSSNLGNITSDQFFNHFVQTPQPNQIWVNTQNIMAQKISAQSGLSFNNALNNLQSITNQNPRNIFNLLNDPSIQSGVFNEYSPNYINDIGTIGHNIVNGSLDFNSGMGLIGSGQLIHNIGGATGYNNFVNQFGSLPGMQNQPFGNITNNISNQLDSQINNWTGNYNGNIFNTGLDHLFNGNIDQFLSNISTNYLNTNLLNSIDSTIAGNLNNMIGQLLNGNLSYSELNNYLIPNLGNTLNNNNIPQFANLNQAFNANIGSSIGTLSNIFGNIPASDIFTNCRQKIAQDNIIHLTDIISTFYLNKRTQFYYNIQSDDHGELLAEDAGKENLLFPNFFERQIFNHFIQDTIDIITTKTTGIFRTIYPRDEKGLIDVNQRNDIWRNDCIDRNHEYLKSCKEYLHVNF